MGSEKIGFEVEKTVKMDMLPHIADENHHPSITTNNISRAAANVQTIDAFKDWIRNEIRPILPHGALACGHGQMYGVLTSPI